jgi:hypothetical protein
MTKQSIAMALLVSLGSVSLVVPAPAQDAATGDTGTLDEAKAEKVFSAKPAYSPYVGRDFPTRPLFGDTHLHTAASFDAGAFGARLTPRDALRFARGEEITASSGQPAKLSRPLDFLVVADHSDNMGFFPDLLSGKPELLADPTGKKWFDMIKSGQGAAAAIDIITSFSHGTFPKDLVYAPGTRAYKSAWLDNIAAAEEFNDPGRLNSMPQRQLDVTAADVERVAKAYLRTANRTVVTTVPAAPQEVRNEGGDSIARRSGAWVWPGGCSAAAVDEGRGSKEPGADIEGRPDRQVSASGGAEAEEWTGAAGSRESPPFDGQFHIGDSVVVSF